MVNQCRRTTVRKLYDAGDRGAEAGRCGKVGRSLDALDEHAPTDGAGGPCSVGGAFGAGRRAFSGRRCGFQPHAVARVARTNPRPRRESGVSQPEIHDLCRCFRRTGRHGGPGRCRIDRRIERCPGHPPGLFPRHRSISGGARVPFSRCGRSCRRVHASDQVREPAGAPSGRPDAGRLSGRTGRGADSVGTCRSGPRGAGTPVRGDGRHGRGAK